MAVPRDHPLTKNFVHYYRVLIIATGSVLLLLVTSQNPGTLHIGAALITTLFVVFLINFPVRLLHNEISFIQVITLGSGLLYGTTTAGWAATIGIFLGYAVRRQWLDNLTSRSPMPLSPWLQASLTMGWHNTALLLTLLLTGHSTGVINDFNNLTVVQVGLSVMPPLLLYALFHGVLYSLDFLLAHQNAYHSLRRDFLPLVLVEVLPLPFIIIVVMSYPTIGITALAALGAVPVVVAILIHGMNSARSNLERRLQELSTLNQVSQVLRSTLDLEELLSVIQSQVSKFLAVSNFYIALYDPEYNRIWYPLAVKDNERKNWPARAPNVYLTDRVIREQKSILLAHISGDSLASLDLPVTDIIPTSWIGVPLISSNRVIGCLALFSQAPQTEFAQADLDLLTIISGQISIAIDNALLFKQAQGRATQLETLNQISTLIVASLDPQEVLTQVCRSVSRVTSGKHSAIFLLDPEESQVWLAHAHELPDEFVRQNQSFSIAHNGRTRCLRTGHPVLTTDLNDITLERDYIESLEQAGIQAFGDFPLITPEGQIGYLAVYFDKSHRFSEEEVELLQTFASHAALAVSNARLHARTDLALSQRAHQLSILEAVGRELAAATHSEQLFEMILNYALEFTDSPWGSLGLYDPPSGTIEIKASKGYKHVQGFYSINNGISGRAMRTQQVINVGDVSIDPDYLNLTDDTARSQLSIPLTHEGRVLGVLTLENPEINGYTTSEQAFISQLANQAAIAVVNAELYGETQRRLREQSTLYLVSTRLAGTLELESVLHIVQDAVKASLANSTAGIYLWDESLHTYILQPAPWDTSLATMSGRQTAPTEKDEVTTYFPGIIIESDLGDLASALLEPTPLQFSTNHDALKILHYPDHQTLIFPLVANQQRLGMVLLLVPGEITLQDDDLQLLSAVIAQGAISLQNALLFSDVTKGRDRLAAVLDSVKEGIMMIEADGYITLVNESIQEIAGVAPHELRGKRLTDLSQQILDPLGFTPQEAQSLIDALAQRRSDITPETTQISILKPERYLERSSLPVLGHRNGGTIGWMIILRDVTQEHEITQAREVITETLVHDLRSPLSAVLGAVDVVDESLLEESDVDPIVPQALQLARRGATRVLGLVESMLDISRMQSGIMDLSLTRINLHSLATTILTDFIPQANEYGVLMRNDIPPDLPEIHADLNKINRVLMNLMDNALKFTPTGEQVILSAELYPDNMIAVKVMDKGPGIPEIYHEKIFERFTQVPDQHGRRRGTGLGLTFCRLAVEAHGGRIWVEPRSGGGSSFAFTLPIVRPENSRATE